jgi:hypothetical protein
MSDNKEELKDFIVARENQRPLVVSREKLVLLVKELEIKGEDLIYCDKQKVWKKARNVKGLRSLIARLETGLNDDSSDPEQDLGQEDDLMDDILFKKNEEKELPVQRFIPLPEILATKSLQEIKPEPIKISKPVVASNAKKEEAWIESIEKFSFKDSSIKTWVQYGTIFCFLMVLVYNFYPSSGKLTIKDYIHGKITCDGELLKNLTIGAKGEGREVYGFVNPDGTYRIENLPKGVFKIKLIPLIPSQLYSPSPSGIQKKESKDKKKKPEVIYAKYETYENDFSIEYSGGVKQLDIELKSK